MNPTRSSSCKLLSALPSRARQGDDGTGALKHSKSRQTVTRLRNTETILLLSFFALLLFPLLYICRFLDDNSLTSWRWVFADVGIMRIFIYLSLAILFSYFFSKKIVIEKHPYLSLLLFPFVVVLPLWSEPEMILDSSRYFLQSKHVAEYGMFYFIREWGNGIGVWTDMPLIPFLYGLLFRLFGETRWIIQLFNTLLFTSTIFLTYLIGRALWNEEVGFYGALLLLGIPYLPTQVPVMLVDIPTMFFLTLSIYTSLKAIKEGGVFWIMGSALAISMTLFSKYSMWLMISSIPVISIVYLRDAPAAVLRRTVLILCLVAVLSGCLFIAKYDVIRNQVALLRTFQWSGLKLWHESYLSTFLYQVHPFITILALYALYKAVKEKDARLLIAGWGCLLVCLFQIKRIRYILPLFPLFTLISAYGLSAVSDKWIKRFTCSCIVSSSLVILFGAYLPFLKTTSMMNLRHAGNYLNTLDSEIVEVYALPQMNSSGNTAIAMPLLDLFTHKQLISAREWSTAMDRQVFKNASLRFTWEMRRPEFYRRAKGDKVIPGVVIACNDDHEAPLNAIQDAPERSVTEKFTRQTKFFRYKTLVSIHE